MNTVFERFGEMLESRLAGDAGFFNGLLGDIINLIARYVASIDRETLKQLLTERKDMSRSLYLGPSRDDIEELWKQLDTLHAGRTVENL